MSEVPKSSAPMPLYAECADAPAPTDFVADMKQAQSERVDIATYQKWLDDFAIQLTKSQRGIDDQEFAALRAELVATWLLSKDFLPSADSKFGAFQLQKFSQAVKPVTPTFVPESYAFDHKLAVTPLKVSIIDDVENSNPPPSYIGIRAKKNTAEVHGAVDSEHLLSVAAYLDVLATLKESKEIFGDLTIPLRENTSYIHIRDYTQNWNDYVSSEFLRLNKDGRYDDFYLKYFKEIFSNTHGINTINSENDKLVNFPLKPTVDGVRGNGSMGTGSFSVPLTPTEVAILKDIATRKSLASLM